MSREAWEKLYRDWWLEFVSLEHIETVLRRGVGTGSGMGNIITLLWWFHFCVKEEHIDPLQGGFFRRKYRKDRRPTLAVESPFVFYPRFVANLIYKHVKLAQLVWRFHWFRTRLERDPAARAYTDVVEHGFRARCGIL